MTSLNKLKLLSKGDIVCVEEVKKCFSLPVSKIYKGEVTKVLKSRIEVWSEELGKDFSFPLDSEIIHDTKRYKEKEVLYKIWIDKESYKKSNMNTYMGMKIRDEIIKKVVEERSLLKLSDFLKYINSK